MSAKAEVTVKLSTTEFKLIEQALRSLIAVHKEIVADMSEDASERQKARKVVDETQALLGRLA
jgi:hypothetical protein